MKGAVALLMDYACTLTRHAGACGLVNQRWSFGWNEVTDEARVVIPNPLSRLWFWANDVPTDASVAYSCCGGHK